MYHVEVMVNINRPHFFGFIPPLNGQRAIVEHFILLLLRKINNPSPSP